MSQLEDTQAERILSYSAFRSIQAFHGLEEAPSPWRTISFIQPTDSDATPAQKHPHGHSRINFGPISRHPVAQSS